MGDADGGREHGGVERAGERDEDPPPPAPRPAQRRRRSAAEDERRGEKHHEPAERDHRRDHSSLARSARLATTRMSMPGSSRTMRDRSEPPKISRRRLSSGVPTKM